jgi:shikimate dehydrogenase
MIGARTRLVGLLGWPVSHSASPAMHNAGFAALGLDWAYLPLGVEPARLGAAVEGLRAFGFRGANVTVPHKRSVIAHLDALTPRAQALGAVNTILRDDGGAMIGDNTDAPGCVADLRALGFEVAGCAALVLGAGGAGRAVAYGLAEAGARRVVIENRDRGRAERLVEDIAPRFEACRLEARALAEQPAGDEASFQLLINATSVGLADPGACAYAEARPICDGQWAYDLIYGSTPTRFLRRAATAGGRAHGGAGMLLRQGALAFEWWTGRAAPLEVMARALEEARTGAG